MATRKSPRKSPTPAPETPTVTLATLPLTDIILLDTIQSRVSLYAQRVEEFTTRYREYPDDDNLFDPLEVFLVEGVPHLAGGFHRLQGALAAGRTTHPCRVHHGTLREAMIFAIRDNVQSTLPYSTGDKERIILRLLADPEYGDQAHWSDRALGREFGISNVYVSRIRNRLETQRLLMAEVLTVNSPATDAEVLTVNSLEPPHPSIDRQKLSTFLSVTPEELERAARERSWLQPAELVRSIALRMSDHNQPREAVTAAIAEDIRKYGKPPEPPEPRAPRPRLSPEERQARQEMKEREESARAIRLLEREWDELKETLRQVGSSVRSLSPRPLLDDGSEGARDYAGLFACIPNTPHNRGVMTRLLGEAFEAVQGLKTAWESRTK